MAARGGGSARCRPSGSGCSTTRPRSTRPGTSRRAGTHDFRDGCASRPRSTRSTRRSGGVNMHDLAREVVAIAEAGLKARAIPGAGGLIPDETHFLDALRDSVETGMTPADELIARFKGDWNGDASRVSANTATEAPACRACPRGQARRRSSAIRPRPAASSGRPAGSGMTEGGSAMRPHCRSSSSKRSPWPTSP